MSYIQTVIAKAKENKKTIVLPESRDPRILQAATEIVNQNIADIILLGDPADIHAAAQENQLDLSTIEIVNPVVSKKMPAYIQAFYEMRKEKGISLEQAKHIMADPLYYGVMMVKMGDADGMVAGAINSTGNTLRPALQILKTAPGTKIVSSFFIMDIPGYAYGEEGYCSFLIAL